jgi:hypothetical protein
VVSACHFYKLNEWILAAILDILLDNNREKEASVSWEKKDLQ